MGDAGTVDEDIDGAAYRGEYLFNTFLGSNVAGESGGGCTCLLKDAGNSCIEAGLIQVDQDDVRALRCEEFGDRKTDAAGSSGHHGTFSI